MTFIRMERLEDVLSHAITCSNSKVYINNIAVKFDAWSFGDKDLNLFINNELIYKISVSDIKTMHRDM